MGDLLAGELARPPRVSTLHAFTSTMTRCAGTPEFLDPPDTMKYVSEKLL